METPESQKNSHGSGRTLSFTVEDKPYTSSKQYLTGAEIKKLAGLPKESELFSDYIEPMER